MIVYLLRSIFGDDAVILRETDFQLLLLSSVFPILGVALVSPILNSLIDPFGASPANIGLIVSFLTVSSLITIPMSGLLADRYGRRPVLIAALVLFGGGGTAIALTTDFRIVLALRFVQGIGFGGILPIITASIGDMYAGGREATGQGIRMMMTGLSAATFPLLAAGLVVFAWQYPFLLYALAFPVAVLVYLRFEEPTSNEDAAEAMETAAYRRAMMSLLRWPRASLTVVARTFPAFVWVGFLTYNSLVVVRLMGGSPLQAGVLVTVGSFFFAAASQVGRILPIFGGRLNLLVVANVALAVGFVGFLFTSRPAVAVIWVSMVGIGFSVSVSLYRSVITEFTPESLRAGVVSLGAAGARLVATVTPILMGISIEVATPVVGEAQALQFAGVAVAILGGGGGLLCLFVASISNPVPDDPAEL